MKKHILFLLLICLTSSAQEKTLFWEISGNGLTKKSYLYGTMHVNDKVSYHLSDAFFEHLLNADIIANESDPETWNDLSNLSSETDFNAYRKFYKEFYKKPTNKSEIKAIFNIKNAFFNNLLSAIGGESSDFQENTVLDMFIYQTGRKYNKINVGLEDARGSLIPILKIKEEDARPKDENLQLLVKIMKNQPFTDVLKQYYREKDIVMLDSLYKLMMSKKAHDVLISIRNENMTRSIDSLAKKGSLFSAVGAAHLAGDEGIISLLRKRGYILKPIIDNISEQGNKKKKAIEDYFPNPGFINSITSDGMISIPLTKNVFEEFKDVAVPDYTNGGVINIKRVPLNYYLNKTETDYNIKSLDSLFFENIPGTILEKKMFKTENSSGYDIKSVTKTGNAQRFKFFITPLEIIGISMTGVGNYVRQFENEIFENIKLKSTKSVWETIMPNKGGFSIEIPSFYSSYGNKISHDDIEIQAYDSTTKSYYFLTEKTNNDIDLLENSEYEQHQIQYEFYLQHDAEIVNSSYDKTTKSLETSSKVGTNNIHLKTFIQGNKYYLLGAVAASEFDKNRFFSSFKNEPFVYKNETSIYTDSISKYSIEIPKKLNDKLFSHLDLKEKNTKNKFEEKIKYTTYNSETRKSITLLYNKYSKYESIATIDSLRINFREYFLKESENTKNNYDDEEYDYDNVASVINLALKYQGISSSKWNNYIKNEEEKYEMLSETFDYNKEKNIYILNNIVSRKNSDQAIKYKTIFINDSYYMLSTLIHRNYKNDDAFIEKTFSSLHPFGENLNHNYSIFDHKINLFLNDAKSESDTIRFSAMNSIKDLDLRKKDLPIIKNFIETFHFKDSETAAIQSLMKKIGLLQDESVIPFLNNLYKKEDAKTAIQLGVIQALINLKSKKGYQKIIELLEYDLPISDNEYEIKAIFSDFEDDLEHSKELFPKIFQFYSVKEYNEPIISLCNSLLDKNLVDANKIKSFKKMILTNAKLEYKRVASRKEKNKLEEEDVVSTDVEDYDSYVDNTNATSLKNYIGLLYKFKKDKSIDDYFSKVKKLNLPEIDLEFTRLGIINNHISNDEIQVALTKEQNRFVIVNLLLNKNKESAIKLTDDNIAKAAILNLKSLTAKDSIVFIDKKIVEQLGKKTIYYFYKTEKKSSRYEVAKKTIYTVAFVLDNQKINPLAFKTFEEEHLEDDEETNKKLDLIIKKSMNEKHYRASFEKLNENENNYLYGDY